METRGAPRSTVSVVYYGKPDHSAAISWAKRLGPVRFVVHKCPDAAPDACIMMALPEPLQPIGLQSFMVKAIDPAERALTATPPGNR